MTEVDETGLPLFRSAEGQERFMRAYDAVLRVWPVAHEERDVPTRFGTTHVVASGPPEAPALVLLHSMAGTATLWRPNVEALSREHRVYALDVIGQVGKSVPSRRLRCRADFADWLVDVLDALGVARASLVGSSYGGFLALSQAALTPSRVGRVVLISPAGTFAGGLLWVFLKAMLKRPFTRKKERDVTDLLGKGAVLAREDAAWGELMTITMRESAPPNLVPPIVFKPEELRSIEAPTLLLIGENEVLYPPRRTLDRARRRMPGLTGAIVPGAHHLAALAAPDDVNRRILEFLGAGSA